MLPEEVAANKVIIQSTLNSEVTNQQKGQLWQDIARKGSNCGVCVRTPDQVHEKLSDTKKDFFTHREEKKGKKRKTTTKNKQRKQQQQQQQKQETNKQNKQNGELERPFLIPLPPPGSVYREELAAVN